MPQKNSIKTDNPNNKARILVIIPNFPSNVQTFIAKELSDLSDIGYEMIIWPQKSSGNDPFDLPISKKLERFVRHHPSRLLERLQCTFRAWVALRRTPGYAKAKRALIGEVFASVSVVPLLNFVKALRVSREVNKNTDLVYAQFFRQPASIAYFVSLLTSAPWACSAHARDIWLSTPHERNLKVNSASWIASCTTVGSNILKDYANDPDTIHTIYHGVDKRTHPPYDRPVDEADGRYAATPIKILTVGRIVEKKGFNYLIEALSMLPNSLQWSLTHIGPGKRTHKLQKLAVSLGVDKHIDFVGYVPQDVMLDYFRRCDVFVLPSVVAKDGDMDGLPNSLAEAASQQMCCISTNISEIPQMFTSGTDCLLVPERDSRELADALNLVLTDPKLRHSLGKEAAVTIREKFDHDSQMFRLSELFGQTFSARSNHDGN